MDTREKWQKKTKDTDAAKFINLLSGTSSLISFFFNFSLKMGEEETEYR